jgi:TPR repeat protein
MVGIAPEMVSLARADAPAHECDRLAASAADPRRVAPGVAFDKIDVARAVPACEEAVRLYPDERRFTFQLGRAYQASPAPQRALPLYEKLAALGHGLAIISLGVMYGEGRGVAKDDSKAVKLFLDAARLGELLAMMNVAIAYEHGRGIRKDENEAAEWFRKAAERGHPVAMTRLGGFFENGRGVARDPLEAVRWYRAAARTGDAAGMTQLASMYLRGEGVRRDETEAANWFRRAADGGDPTAMFKLAELHVGGRGVERSPERVAQLIMRGLDTDGALTLDLLRPQARKWPPELFAALQNRMQAAGAWVGPLDRTGSRTMSMVEHYVRMKERR